MTRKLLVLLLPLFLFIFTASAKAQTTTDAIVPTASFTSTQETAAADATTKLRLQTKLIQEQKKAAVSKVREEAKALLQVKRSEFKVKLQVVVDQRKKALAERIDTKLASINEKHTTKFLEVLVRLQAFLDKIKQSTTIAAVLADVAVAQTAIDTAEAAVEAQAGKDYSMTITDDATLKSNAGMIVSQLRLDLTATYKQVIDAKQAVQKLNTDRELIKKEASRSAEL